MKLYTGNFWKKSKKKNYKYKICQGYGDLFLKKSGYDLDLYPYFLEKNFQFLPLT
jgi:hypothetical protein